MKIIVNAHDITIIKEEPINEQEVNISDCSFEFIDEITEEFVKEAIFVKGNIAKIQEIFNNRCNYPPEILKSEGTCLVGVVATLTRDGKIIKRYTPTPRPFLVDKGSLIPADNSQPITPSEMEQYKQALKDGLNEINKRLEVVEQIGKNVQEQGVEAKKQGEYAKEQGDYAKEKGKYAKETSDTLKSDAESGAFNGKSLEFIWQGTKLGVRLEGDTEYKFADLQGIQGIKGDTGESCKIKKTYPSIQAMRDDFNNMEFGDYVMIASTIEEEDNAKLYTRGETEWIFITDFSGAMGIQGPVGKTPNIEIGTVTTLDLGSKATVTRTGTDENPILNFGIPKGEKGDTYQVSQDDLNNIATEITNNANSKFNENVDNKTTEFNTNADNKLNDFNSNASSYNERITTNENNIASNEDYMYKITPKNKVKDSQVHIEDALNLPVFEVGIDGKDFQVTTTGRNILDTNNLKEQTINGVTLTPVYKNGLLQYIEANGTSTGIVWYVIKRMVLEENVAYSFLANSTDNNLRFYTDTSSYVTDKKENILNTFTTEQNVSIQVPNAVTLTNAKIYPMISKNSTIDNYEPFTGKTPVPNPDFPQNIETLKGYNFFDYDSYTYDNTVSSVYRFVEIKNLKPNTDYTLSGYEKITRKNTAICLNKKPENPNVIDNLYKFLKTAAAWDNEDSVTFTTDDTGKCYLGIYDTTEATWNEIIQWFKNAVLVEGTEVKPYVPYGHIGIKIHGKNFIDKLIRGSGIWRNGKVKFYEGYSRTDFIKVDSNETYYCTHVFGDVRGYAGWFFDKNYNAIKPILISGEYDVSGKITVPQNAVYVVLNFYNPVIDVTPPILSKTSSEIPYEPYKERIYCLDLKGHEALSGDKIVVDKKGNVKLIKNWEKVVFDGSEHWIKNMISEKTFRFTLVFDKAKNNVRGYCTHNKFVESGVSNDDELVGITSGILYFRISKNIITNYDEILFKNWLKEQYDNGKPVVVYYQLADPKPISLGTIDPIETFEGINNIEVLASLDTEIEVEYVLEIKKYIDNLHKPESEVVVQNAVD